MIEGNYFPHKIGARNDPKLGALKRMEGEAGKGVWWDLVEYLYECKGYLPADLGLVAYILQDDHALVERVVKDYGLFELTPDGWTNSTALDCIDKTRAASEQKREAGRQGGLARGRQQKAEGTPVQAPLEAPLEAPLQAPLEANKINKIKKINKENNPGDAPARERKREEGLEDLFYEIFFKRDFISPAAEVRRALKYCDENEVKDPRKLAESWAPENKTRRFNDTAVIDWCLRMEKEIADSSVPAEGVEFLRAIDAISVNKHWNRLEVRMRNQAWGEALASLLIDNQGFKSPYDSVTVTKRNPETL